MCQKIILILFLLISVKIDSQSITKPLIHPHSFYFKQHVYVFGFQQKPKELQFKCYRYSNALQLKDSTEVNLGNYKPEQFLEITTDTLHSVLNFYFQLANQKNVVSLFRLNDTLGKIGFTENYDANHINSLTAFDDEKFISTNDLYLVRTSIDTSGKQFFVSKYQLKSITQPFEYDFKWQFALDRKFIHRASVVYSDTNFVLVHVNVSDGLKKGQWLLRLHAKTGELIKGTKLNLKGDTRHFLMSNYSYDLKLKTVDIIGSIYPNETIDFKKETSDFKNSAKTEQLFLIQIDSLGEVSSRTEKSLTLPLQANKLNPSSTYHLKIRTFTKTKDHNYSLWADIYESNSPLILTYTSSWYLDLMATDIDFDLAPSKFVNGTSVLPNFISYEKGDAYGKFYLDSPGDYDKFKYKAPKNSVVLKTGLDDINNTFFVFKKTDITNSTKQFYYVFLGKKGLENKVILKTNKGQQANLYFTNTKSYISFLSNVENTQFEIKINTL